MLKDSIENEASEVNAETLISGSKDQHVMEEKPLQLSKYESMQSSKEERKDKTGTVMRKPGNIIECDECDFFCDRPSILKDHVYVIHKGMSYNCETCDATYLAKKRLMEHIRMKHEPPLQCDECNFSANGNVALKKHYIRVTLL